jgi:hypothetical protein
MIDREKVLAVLRRRFPDAGANTLAAAANAIVGLKAEYEPLDETRVNQFRCQAGPVVYTVSDVASGRVRLYRQVDPS